MEKKKPTFLKNLRIYQYVSLPHNTLVCTQQQGHHQLDFLCLATHKTVASQNKMERTDGWYLYQTEGFDLEYTKKFLADNLKTY